MSAQPGRHFETPYNVVASLAGEDAARSAALRTEMQHEVNRTWTSPFDLMPEAQALWGTVRDDITPAAERAPEAIVAVHSDDRATPEGAAAILGTLGADRVAFVDATGTPLPPQKRHPRRADPPGYRWKHAGSG